MKLVVGLGNPGPGYENTRHNLGTRVVAAVASGQLSLPAEALRCPSEAFGVGGAQAGVVSFPSWERKERLFADIAQGGSGAKKIILALPFVYMNESGKAVGALIKFYKIKPDDLLVIHDDSDIFFGKMKLSYGSRSAGHRGVESVIRALGTKNFWRLRIGIRPPNEELRKKADELILEPFTALEEQKLSDTIFPHAQEMIRAWLDK